MTPRHIPSVQLVLSASGDLPLWTRLSVERHVSQCDDCAALVREYARQQLDVAQRAEEVPAALTGAAWHSLASEMTANIRLGLAAGECVSTPAQSRARPRLTFALAGLAVILSIIAVERPRFHFAVRAVPAELVSPAPLASFAPMLEGTGDRIGIRNGARELSVTAPAGIKASDVIRTVNAGGEIGSRYVEDTGVTVVNIYAE